MKNRKNILTSLVISTVLLAPTATTVFADTVPTLDAQPTLEAQPAPAPASTSTPQQKMEDALKLAKFDSSSVKDLEADNVGRYYGDKNLLAKEITINGQQFEMVVFDEKNPQYTADLGNGKSLAELVKESEKTHVLNLGFDMAAYYKDGIFILAPTTSGDKEKLEANQKIIKNIFVNILDKKAPVVEAKDESQLQPKPKAPQPQNDSKSAKTPEDLVKVVTSNPIFKDVDDIKDPTALKENHMSYGRTVTIDGAKFAIGTFDPSGMIDAFKSYIYETTTTHKYMGVAAYYHNGVYVISQDKLYVDAQSRMKGIENPLVKKAHEVLPQIIKLIDGSSSADFVDQNKNDQPKVDDSGSVDLSSAAVGFGDAAGGFGDTAGGFGDSAFGVANPQTFDSSISSYIGAIGASIAGILTTVGIRKRK